MPDTGVLSQRGSVEGRGSWVAACLALAVLAVAYGAPLVVVVGLKPIQVALGSDRSVIALAGALTWVGTGLGGILMGWVADRIGIRITASIGAVMTAAGLALAGSGSIWALYVGHGLLIGVFGNGALYAPLLIYVSRWFDRRRGTALALISSGQYIPESSGPRCSNGGSTVSAGNPPCSASALSRWYCCCRSPCSAWLRRRSTWI